MSSNGKSPSFITSLVTPGPGVQSGKKSWSVDVESVWVPFFTATNTMGDTEISPETLGAPIRLATDKAGNVRFTQSGRPSMRIAPELTQQIRIVRENFVASLMDFSGTVMEEHAEAYAAKVKLNQDAATPVLAQDEKLLQEELDRQAAALAAEQAAEASAKRTRAPRRPRAANPPATPPAEEPSTPEAPVEEPAMAAA